ncbi:hypothetical protein V3C33_01950 [Micrococcaceae bacterium Sec5.7]
MSHVIENALFYDDVEALRREFRASLGRDSLLQLSEMAAFYILGSEPFARLLAEALRVAELAASLVKPEEMARAVVGQPMNNQYPQLHELISGPFDADKMDYMARDAKMCGVPVVTDFTRLTQKVRAALVSSHDLPPELGRLVDACGSTGHLIIGIASSGAATLDEVALGRSLMFDKIYRHHKVRAAEAMVASICSRALIYLHENPAMVPFALNDEQLLDITVEWLEAHALQDGQERADMFSTAADIADRLRKRDLFVRAFAFASVLPNNDYRGAEEQRVAFDQLFRAAGDPESRAEVIASIAANTREIAGLANLSGTLDRYGDLEAYIALDPPANKTIDRKPDPSRAYLIDSVGQLAPVDRIQADTRAWVDAYVNVRDLGYVFAPRDIADLVHVATEVVFRTEFELRVPRGHQAYSRHDPAIVDKLKRTLQAENFYQNKPRDLEPVPGRLLKADVVPWLGRIRARLSGYAGPVTEQESGRVSESKLNDGRLLDWLAQFPEDLIDCALIVLENIQFLGRDEVAVALNAFHLSRPEVTTAALTSLGAPKDGSSVLTYFANDLASAINWTVRTLEDALISGDPIIFVDDLLGTGRSAMNILAGWLGETAPDPLDEERPPLEERLRDLLRKTPLHFIFLASLSGGKAYLEQGLDKLGLTGTVFVANEGASVETIQSLSVKYPQLPWEDFRNFAGRVGYEVLLDKRAKPEDWREQRKLGYGNEGVIRLSAFNTPTATLTAVWKAG